MKKNALQCVLLVAALSAAGCARDFAPPPPVPSIEEISPPSAFAEEPVELLGKNFAAAAEDNLVFFGSTSAKVIDSEQGKLTVEVPLLETGEQVYVTVSTSDGQGTSTQRFTYSGPGHPTEQRIGHMVDFPAGPYAVTQGRFRDDAELPVVMANAWSSTVGIIDTVAGKYYGIGVNDTPFSLAWSTGANETDFLYLVSLRSDQAAGLPSRLEKFPVLQTDDGPRLGMPDPVELGAIDGQPFLPARVWSYCTQDGCDDQRLVVLDLYRPALAIVEPGDSEQSKITYIDDPDSICVDRPAMPAPFGDVVRHTTNSATANDRRLIACIGGKDELWAIPDNYPGGPCPELLFTSGARKEEELTYAFSALALCHGGSRLYAASTRALRVFEFELEGKGENLAIVGGTPSASGELTATPFAMTCAVPPVSEGNPEPAPRLYVATGEGIAIFDTSGQITYNDELPLLGFVPADPAMGGPQSLGRIGRSSMNEEQADVLLFADLLNDQVRFIPAGDEAAGSVNVPAGNPLPQIAPSRFEDQLYLADPHINMLRAINQNTGLQTAQFPVMGIDSFGAADIFSTSLGPSEALLVPMPPEPGEGGGLSCDGFSRLVVRLIHDTQSLEQWHYDWRESGYNTAGRDLDETDSGGCFDDVFPAPRHLSALLARYGGDDARIWSMGLDENAEEVTGMVGHDLGMCFDEPIPGDIRMARIDTGERVFALLSRADVDNPRIEIFGMASPEEKVTLPLDEYTCMFASDMAIRLDGDDQPTVYLALPLLGQVVSLRPGKPAHAVQTAGNPTGLFLSPDARRLYATHLQGNRVSIIDVGCEPQPGCERVLCGLDVEDHPVEVSFHPSGEKAYLTHFHKNAITVIE